MRRFLLITGLALACSGCAYGPDYGYGYGAAAYPYGYGGGYAYPSYGYGAPAYAYSAPAYGYSAPYYGYSPGAGFNFGFFGGGDHDHHWDGDHQGDWHRWGDGGHDSHGNGFQGGGFHGGGQARGGPPPAPRVSAPAPRFPPGTGINVGKNYGGPEGGPR